MCAVLLGLGRTKGIAYVSDLYKVGPSTASGSRERRGVWPGLDPSLAYVVAEVSNNESSTSDTDLRKVANDEYKNIRGPHAWPVVSRKQPGRIHITRVS